MDINTFIISKEFKQGVYAINWRYHIDEYGVYWYKFDDVVDMLELKWNIANKLYDEFLDDNEKIIFEDTDIKHGVTNEFRFISSTGFDRLLDHECERYTRVRDAKTRLENSKYNDELTKNVRKLYNLVDDPLKDHDKIKETINELYYSDYIQDTLEKPIVEEVDNDDKLRKELIKAYDEDRLEDFTIIEPFEYVEYDYENEDVKLKKRPGVKKTTYKRNKNKESTCPSWLKSIVK